MSSQLETVLALDLARTLGWAAWRRDKGIIFGSHRMPPAGSNLARYLADYNQWLRRALMKMQPDAVAFETPWIGPQTHQATARQLMCLAGMTEWICGDWGLDSANVHECNNSTVRKHFCGMGAGKREKLKKLTMDRCRLYGFAPKDDNEADAIAILDYYLHFRGVGLKDIAVGPLFAKRLDAIAPRA